MAGLAFFLLFKDHPRFDVCFRLRCQPGAIRLQRRNEGPCCTLPYSNNDLPNLSRAFLFRALLGEVWSVQDVHAPFDHFDDGNSYSDGESKKQNELDDHFSAP